MSNNKVIKGKRPEIFETPGVDYLMHMVMVLAQELSATRDRLDTFEKIAEQKGVLTGDEFDSFAPSQETLESREARRQTFLSNLFSVMTQESAELAAKDTKARFEDVIDTLAR